MVLGGTKNRNLTNEERQGVLQRLLELSNNGVLPKGAMTDIAK